MNNDQFEDLKQFIDSRIAQSEATFDEKLDSKIDSIKKDIEKLRKEMLDGFAGVGEAVENIHKQLDDTKIEFETRLTKLERQAA